MSLTDDDIKALRLLMRQEIEPFRSEVNERFREVDRRFENLYAQNDDRQREYLFMSEQLGRHDKQLANISEQLDRIETKIGRHDQYFDDLDGRVTQLEKKSA